MEEGNGHKTIEQLAKEKAFEGKIIHIGELQRQDGILAESVDKMAAKGLGVIQTLITAKDDDVDYRQILKLARWKDEIQRDRYVKALAVCRMTGAKMAAKTLLDKITADSAGDNGAIMREAIEGITHTTLTTREELSRKFKNNDNRYKSNSPIA